MAPLHDCPLCPDSYEGPTDLRVHLEVEHRKSELAGYAVDHHGERGSDAEGEPANVAGEDPSRTPPA